MAAGYLGGGDYSVAWGARQRRAPGVPGDRRGWSIGDYSLTVGFEEGGHFAEQAAAGQAVPGRPFRWISAGDSRSRRRSTGSIHRCRRQRRPHRIPGLPPGHPRAGTTIQVQGPIPCWSLTTTTTSRRSPVHDGRHARRRRQSPAHVPPAVWGHRRRLAHFATPRRMIYADAPYAVAPTPRAAWLIPAEYLSGRAAPPSPTAPRRRWTAMVILDGVDVGDTVGRSHRRRRPKRAGPYRRTGLRPRPGQPWTWAWTGRS